MAERRSVPAPDSRFFIPADPAFGTQLSCLPASFSAMSFLLATTPRLGLTTFAIGRQRNIFSYSATPRAMAGSW